MVKLNGLLAYRTPRTLAGTCVGTRALAAQRQTATMSDTTIRTEIHESLDVHGDGTSQVAFYGVPGDFRTNGLDFGLGKVLDFGIGLNAAACANLARGCAPDAVDPREGNLCMLVRCYVNSGYTGHFKSSPTQFLIVRREKRVRIAFARLKIKQKDSTARTQHRPRRFKIFQYFSILHSGCNNSALTLLVAAILADDPHHTIASYDLAVAANTLDGSTHFHVVTPLFRLR
jgi:hypothetical protein